MIFHFISFSLFRSILMIVETIYFNRKHRLFADPIKNQKINMGKSSIHKSLFFSIHSGAITEQ